MRPQHCQPPAATPHPVGTAFHSSALSRFRSHISSSIYAGHSIDPCITPATSRRTGTRRRIACRTTGPWPPRQRHGNATATPRQRGPAAGSHMCSAAAVDQIYTPIYETETQRWLHTAALEECGRVRSRCDADVFVRKTAQFFYDRSVDKDKRRKKIKEE